MASNYNSLGFNLMTTGENAGTWGTNTNLNLNYLRDTFGYISIAMTSDRTLTIPDNSTGTYDGRAFIIELTGTLGGTRVLDIAATAGSGSSPGGSASILKPFIVFDNTTHSGDTLTFKVTGATGFALSEGTTYLCYHNGTDIINTGLGSGDVTLTGIQTLTNKTLTSPVINTPTGDVATITGTQTLTNKTLTSPKIGTSILDTGGNELALLTATGSAVNEITLANAATGNGPIISTTGDDAAVDLNLNPKGAGVLKSGTAAVKVAGKETMWVPATAMYASTTNGAEATQTELTAGNPELKTFDFDPSTAESVQFNVSFPKSWDFSTAVTFQTFWSASATDTGTGGFTLAGCSVASDVDYDLAFGTPVANTALAASGTQDDLMVNVESGGVTIASAAADTNTIFRLVRDTGTDTNTGDLRLVGIKIYFTTNAANDA